MKHVQSVLALLLLSIASPCAPSEDAARVQRGNFILENVPDTPPALAARLQRRLASRSVGFLDWTGDGEAMLISTRLSDVGQIHRIDSPMNTLRQLTFSPDPLRTAVAQPGGNGFAYAKDNGGDEYYQLYFHDIGTGEATLITDGKRSRNLGMLWSRDGKQLAYLHSPEGTGRYQVRIAPAGTLTASTTILDREAAFSIEDWSPDGKTLLVSRYVSMNESYLYTLSIADRQLRELNPQPPGAARIAYNGGQYPQLLGGVGGGPPKGGRFAPDGQSVYVISDQDSEFARLLRLRLSDGTRTVLTPDAGWDVEGFDLSPDGSTLVYSLNADGVSKLHVIDTRSGVERKAPAFPSGIVGIGRFDRGGRRLALTFAGTAGPADVYVWNLNDQSLTRWSESATSGIDPAVLVEPDLVRFPSFDNREISAFIYRPKRDGKLPVIIHIHGGPETQFRPFFSPYAPMVSALELGFAVIAPNVRGSTGYGKTFTKLDNEMKREDAVKDIGALIEWITRQPSLDKDRIVVHGASYGGYMVNASMERFAGKLKAGVSIVAISDFLTFLKNTAEYRRDLRRAEYGDERDPRMAAFMTSISPLARAHRITAPMFIVHGANDPRVPIGETEQFYSALKANGAEPWLMIASDEGHGFQKQANIRRLEEATILFLQRTVLGEKTPQHATMP